ncbi:DUF402 domain-containing protein [Microbacterium cremeum]|uniref:DUF402 domain-containing protein n=1 Tax=Microbacterium cremeum TaxID=2782169 RepID=UPI001888ECD6|nr:DUF402 domain-containing protein [Microbacterium cremeum]
MALATIQQRYLYPDGRLQAAIPMHVVSDESDVVVGWTSTGTEISYWATLDGADPRTIPLDARFTRKLTTARRTWTGGGTLRVVPLHERWQVLHFWNTETDDFLGWYVNLESEKTRRACCIDAVDWHLDLLISPEFVVTWKDEDEAAAAVGTPYLRAEDLRSARATGEAIASDPRGLIARIGDWRDFKPAPECGPLAFVDCRKNESHS